MLEKKYTDGEPFGDCNAVLRVILRYTGVVGCTCMCHNGSVREKYQLPNVYSYWRVGALTSHKASHDGLMEKAGKGDACLYLRSKN